MGKWLDWVKVRKYLEKTYNVLEIRYYVGVRKNDQVIHPFLRKLAKIGFTLFRKSVKIIIDETGRTVEKANFDVEITGDVLNETEKVDALVLFSGDSDFEYLVKLLHQKGKQLFVYSSKRTLSWELKLSADKCYLLEELLDLTKEKQFAKL
jgi:uncharacterized LabA/DUF88 family protein